MPSTWCSHWWLLISSAVIQSLSSLQLIAQHLEPCTQTRSPEVPVCGSWAWTPRDQSTSPAAVALLATGLEDSLLWSCPECCGVVNSTPVLSPLDISSSIRTTKTGPRHRRMFSGVEVKSPTDENPALELAFHSCCHRVSPGEGKGTSPV